MPAASNRASLISKLHASLKKQYKPAPAQPARPLLEHVLYASLLQDSPAELADEGMAKCEQEFFDWNEVRVTTVTELSQVLSRLPDPNRAAQRLKGNLQAIFEEFYTFDLDHLKKENLGKAISKFEKMPGMTPFVLNYTVQHGLGGHAIPVDYCSMVIMLCTGIASQAEAMAGKVPGLERAIAKSKAIEFSGLLHQAGIALNKNPKDKKGRAVLDGVAKGSAQQLDEWLESKKAAKKRVVKRRAAEKAAAEKAAIEAAQAAAEAAAKKQAAAAKKQAAKAAAEAAKKAEAAAPKSAKKSAAKTTKKAATSKKTAAEKKTATKSKATATTKSKATKTKSAKKSAVKAKAPTKKKKTTSSASKKKSASTARTTKKASKKSKSASTSKKSTNRKLSKRKPR